MEFKQYPQVVEVIYILISRSNPNLESKEIRLIYPAHIPAMLPSVGDVFEYDEAGYRIEKIKHWMFDDEVDGEMLRKHCIMLRGYF